MWLSQLYITVFICLLTKDSGMKQLKASIFFIVSVITKKKKKERDGLKKISITEQEKNENLLLSF